MPFQWRVRSLKEVSYIHSESYAAGELKHGTISLIDEDVPVIAVATQTGIIPKTISNVVEVKSRGAKVILVCTDACVRELKDGVADYVIEIPHTDEPSYADYSSCSAPDSCLLHINQQRY